MRAPVLFLTLVAGVVFGLSTGKTMAEPDASVSAPSGPLPDSTHISIMQSKSIAWMPAGNGEAQARLFGDPDKPGLYGLLIRWEPGHFSHPHFHDMDRYVYVISGIWWVSSSAHFDPTKTYPLPAGTYAEDVANTIHWDGARSDGEPAILELVGMGPVKTTKVGEDGKPLPSPTPH